MALATCRLTRMSAMRVSRLLHHLNKNIALATCRLTRMSAMRVSRLLHHLNKNIIMVTFCLTYPMRKKQADNLTTVKLKDSLESLQIQGQALHPSMLLLRVVTIPLNFQAKLSSSLRLYFRAVMPGIILRHTTKLLREPSIRGLVQQSMKSSLMTGMNTDSSTGHGDGFWMKQDWRIPQ